MECFESAMLPKHFNFLGGKLSHIITGWQGLKSRTGGDIPYFETTQSDDAVEAAKNAEAVVYFIATISGEGSDRGSLSFDQKDLNLISAIAKVNKNVVVGKYI